MRWGKREIIYLPLHCHHQNDSCIRMGSDENHFNVPLTVMDKVTTVSTNDNLFEETGETKRNRCLPAYNALPLGQTGSHFFCLKSLQRHWQLPGMCPLDTQNRVHCNTKKKQKQNKVPPPHTVTKKANKQQTMTAFRKQDVTP